MGVQNCKLSVSESSGLEEGADPSGALDQHYFQHGGLIYILASGFQAKVGG